MGTVEWITLLEENIGWWCNVMLKSLRSYQVPSWPTWVSTKVPGCWRLPPSCLKLLFFLRFVFWCGPFLKSSLNLLQYCFHFTFLFFFLFFGGRGACGILAPWPGIEHTPHALEGEILTTGHQGSPSYSFRVILSHIPPLTCHRSGGSGSGIFWVTGNSSQTCLNKRECVGGNGGKSSLGGWTLPRGSSDVAVNLVFLQIQFPQSAVSLGRLLPCSSTDCLQPATHPLSKHSQSRCIWVS